MKRLLFIGLLLLLGIAVLAQGYGELPDSLSLGLQQAQGQNRQRVEALADVCDYYFQKEQFAEAQPFVNEMTELGHLLDDNVVSVTAQYYQGSLKLGENQFEEAMPLLLAAEVLERRVVCHHCALRRERHALEVVELLPAAAQHHHHEPHLVPGVPGCQHPLLAEVHLRVLPVTALLAPLVLARLRGLVLGQPVCLAATFHHVVYCLLAYLRHRGEALPEAVVDRCRRKRGVALQLASDERHVHVQLVVAAPSALKPVEVLALAHRQIPVHCLAVDPQNTGYLALAVALVFT